MKAGALSETAGPDALLAAQGTRVTRARAQLLLRQPFFGTLALHLRPVGTRRVQTAAVDATHLFFNPEWTASLSDDELLFVAAHEVLHCVLDHLGRLGERDYRLFNVACDYAVNLLLTDAQMTMPRCGLRDERFRGLSAEQIYRLLVQEGSAVQHAMDEMLTPEEGAALAAPMGVPVCSGVGTALPARSALAALAALGARATQAARAARAARAALAAQVARQAGYLPGEILIEGLLSPRLDWRMLLRRFLDQLARTDFRSLPPSRRHLWRGWCLPAPCGGAAHLVVALDTSGSVNEAVLRRFLTEVQGAMGQIVYYRIDLIQCDEVVQRHWEFGPGEPLETEVWGGGGTDFRPVFAWVEERGLRPDALVYLTDGYGPFPDESPQYPVLWVLNTDLQPPWGESVWLEPELEFRLACSV